MTISYKTSENIKKEIIKYYEDLKRPNTPQYAIFQAEEGGTIITLYNSGKVVFQGISADIDANLWFDLEMSKNKRDVRKELERDKDKKDKDNEIDYSYYNLSAIGSDEVGTGDYFGPLVVTASFVDKKHHMKLIDLGVKDSKKLTDDKIRSIAPEIIKLIPHVSYIMDNENYNKNSNYNMNQLKAILHNKVLVSLIEKDSYPYEKIIIDQFVYPKKYYEHLSSANKVVKDILFLTKAEGKNLSVAVSSIISRYIFINEIDKLSKKYNIIIPKGAGLAVDETAKIIVSKYGKDELYNCAKINFKNTERII